MDDRDGVEARVSATVARVQRPWGDLVCMSVAGLAATCEGGVVRLFETKVMMTVVL